MSQFLGGPKVQYLDSNGDPLSGGKLYTYDPGTTDNKASYPTLADAKAKTNANANPVILDSRGEADVVLAGNTKLQLDTTADVNVWTLDNVNGDSTILDANGNEMIEFVSTASAVNHFQMTNSATGNDVVFEPIGTDTDIGITIQAKGSGSVTIAGLGGATSLIDTNSVDALLTSAAASAINEFTITNSAIGNNINLAATGDDTNIGMDIDAKGTGEITMTGQFLALDYGATKREILEALEICLPAASVPAFMIGFEAWKQVVSPDRVEPS